MKPSLTLIAFLVFALRMSFIAFATVCAFSDKLPSGIKVVIAAACLYAVYLAGHAFEEEL